MKQVIKPKIFILIGIILFLVSFVLPAYKVKEMMFFGFECAYIAFAIAFTGDFEGNFLVRLLACAHFLLLGLHNMILPACLFFSKKIVDGKNIWLLYLSAISTLNTIVFFFYTHSVDSSMTEELLIGYYLWVLSSLIMLISIIWKKR